MSVPYTIHHIEVVYDGDSSKMMREIDGKSNELMEGQGGANVFLRALSSQDMSSALTGIHFAHTDDERNNSYDLAKGSGGCYIYLEETTDKNNRDKITHVALLRSDDSKSLSDVQARGFDGMSNDINTGRGHGYLYVVWKTFKH